MRKFFIALTCLTFMLAGSAGAVLVNEFVANDISTDDYEFIELCGDPGESLGNLTVVLIEGETSKGTIDRIIPLAGYTMGANGYFVIGDPLVNPDLEMAAGWIENGGNNILLLADFDAEQFPVGTDIDAEDDCIADFSIGTVVDGVGYGYGYEAADCITYYGIPDLGPDGTYDPAGGARCDDCDEAGEWYMICMNGTQPESDGGIECLEDDGYYIGWATPGAPNDCSPVSNEGSTWGDLKAQYR